MKKTPERVHFREILRLISIKYNMVFMFGKKKLENFNEILEKNDNFSENFQRSTYLYVTIDYMSNMNIV